MPRMTPEQEARYSLDFGVSRDDLSPDVQAAYDQLLKYRAEHPYEPFPEPQPPSARSSPEVRARILQQFKRRRKYAAPFEHDRLSLVSILGTESWAEYGQVVLQMAILDTLLSIEELLSQNPNRE